VVRHAGLRERGWQGRRLLPGRGKFKYRYSTLGFQEAANLDDGDMWAVSYALKKWNPMVDRKVSELVKSAIS